MSKSTMHESLPVLFNNSRKRKRTIDTYRAPPQLRNTVYRCREYPNGVFIDRFGVVCPEETTEPVTKQSRYIESPCEAESDDDYIDYPSSDSDSEEEEEEDEDYNESQLEEESVYSDEEIAKQNPDVACSDFNVYAKQRSQREKERRLLCETQDIITNWDDIKHEYVNKVRVSYTYSIICENPDFVVTVKSKKVSKPTLKVAFDTETMVFSYNEKTFTSIEAIVKYYIADYECH